MKKRCLILGCVVMLAVGVRADFALTLDEVAGLIDRGDEKSLATAQKLIDALRSQATEAERPRVEAYAARLELAEGEYQAAWALVEPFIEDREKLPAPLVDCYFTAGLIKQAMAYRESPDSNPDTRATFMGFEVAVEKPKDDDPPLIGEGLAHAIESLNLFTFIASNAPAPARLDALDQAGRTLIIMHEWSQAKQAYQMAMDQTHKAPAESLEAKEREARVARYQKKIGELDALLAG